jgi:4'-phosphopantetheinyl transferase
MMPQLSLWSARPKCLSLGPNEVHVWRAYLRQPLEKALTLCRILAPDEYRRAESFFCLEARARFMTTRGILRTILSYYLQMSPDLLCFSYNSYGKPSLRQTSVTDDLRFNVSHSHEMALYAVTLGRETGLDLEYVRLGVVCERIAERFLSKKEVEILRALPPNQRMAAFFSCWTCKEAYVKARGWGLSIPLDSFDVSPSAEEPAKPLLIRDNTQDSSTWSLRELTPGDGYVAALVVEGNNCQVSCWQWE